MRFATLTNGCTCDLGCYPEGNPQFCPVHKWKILAEFYARARQAALDTPESERQPWIYGCLTNPAYPKLDERKQAPNRRKVE